MINEAKQSSMTGNSRSLFFCCIIRVYNSNSTHQRHCNGHFPLGDGVHRGGDQRRLQVDLRRQGRGQIDVVCVEIDKTRMQQEIIICETISRFEKLRFRLESYFSNDFTRIFFLKCQTANLSNPASVAVIPSCSSISTTLSPLAIAKQSKK